MQTKQLIFTELKKFEIKDIPLPALKANQVLIKVEFCGLCTWERHIFYGEEEATFPFIGGHEIVGTIIDKGSEVSSNLKVGTSVAVAKWKRCNQCHECRKGLDNQCQEAIKPVPEGQIWGPGGFSEYLIAEGYEVFPLNNIKKLYYGALAEPIACVIRAIRRTEPQSGATAVIIGAGLMGLLFLKILKLRGLKVVVVQRSPYRRELAKKMGADFVVSPEENWILKVQELTEGRGGDYIYYTAGGSQVLNKCLKGTAIGGKILIYAPLLHTEPALEVDEIHYRELEVIGSIRHDKESFRQAVHLISENLISLDDLNLNFGKFADFEEEILRAEKDRECHRILLNW